MSAKGNSSCFPVGLIRIWMGSKEEEELEQEGGHRWRELEEVMVLEGSWGGRRDGSDRPCQGDPACPVLPQQAAQGASCLQQTVCDSATPHSQNLPEYFKKLRLMWKGSHLVPLQYVLNPGFGKRWM